MDSNILLFTGLPLPPFAAADKQIGIIHPFPNGHDFSVMEAPNGSHPIYKECRVLIYGELILECLVITFLDCIEISARDSYYVGTKKGWGIEDKS